MSSHKAQQQQQQQNKKEAISTKIIQRLNHLTPSTSKESIQAFTNWILFHVSTGNTATVKNESQNTNKNRIIYRTLKQVLTFNPKLLQFYGGNQNGSNSNSNSGSGISNQSNEQNAENIRSIMKWSKMLRIYWYIVHELCVCYHDNNNSLGDNTAKHDEENKNWMNYSTFRSMLAETVILPLLQDLLGLLELCAANGNDFNESSKNSSKDGSGGSNDSNTITTVGPPLIVITAIIEAIKDLPIIKDHHKLDNLHSKWKEIDSFQSPTLLDDIKRVIVKIVQFDYEKAKQQQKTTGAKITEDHLSPKSDETEKMVPGEKNTDDGNNNNNTMAQAQEEKIAGGKSTSNAKVQDDGKSASANIITAKKDDSTPMAASTAKSNILNHNPDIKAEGAIATPTISSDADDIVMAENDGDGIDKDLFGDGDDDDDSDNNDKKDASKNVHDKERETVQSIKNGNDDENNIGNSSISSKNLKDDDALTKDSTKSKKRGFVNLDAEVDFDKEGIPKGTVEVHELEVPCQTIGKTQISRDLRNDFSHNLSSALTLVPKKVYEECDKALENNDNSEATITSIVLDDKNSLQIPDEVLDYNVTDAISNIRLHRQIIEKQMEARRKCIELLVKSRCEFGSKTDADTFYSLDEISETLAKRKAQILDAMELEGLDFEGLDEGGNDQNDEMKDDEPTTFTWYTQEDAQINRDIKKQRVE